MLPPTPTGNVFLDAIEPITDPNVPLPTSQINGSAAGTNTSDADGNVSIPTNAERAEFLFPFFDGVEQKLPANAVSQDGLTEYIFDRGPEDTLPATPERDEDGNVIPGSELFENVVTLTAGASDVPVQDFFGFHSAHQLEYVLQFGIELAGTNGARMATFEDENGNRFDVVAIPGERRVFTLQQLTKADLAIIATEVEEALAVAIGTLPENLRNQIESAVGASAGVQGEVDAIIQAALTTINGNQETGDGGIPGLFATPLTSTDPDADDELLARQSEFREVFTKQIANIQTRAAQSSFLDVNEIRDRVNEIVRRAERADKFFTVAQIPPSLSDEVDGLSINVNAPLGDDSSQSGIRQAFDNLIAQETRLRDLDNQRLQLAQTGQLNGGRALDGPNLIAIFQLNYNLTREAEVSAETEELNQQNALLQVYAAVQQLVNDALREFSTGEDGAEEERNIFGRLDGNGNPQNIDQVSERERLLISFIDSGVRGRSTIGHPIEELRNINRPTLNTTENDGGALRTFSQNELNIFASQLADTVTQINQESQILTNEISSLNRERNRHFDLANNSLRRLNDALLTIART